MSSISLGMNATAWRSADGSPSEVKKIKDVTINLSRRTTDVTTRDNDGWVAEIATLKECSVSFTMLKTSDSSDDGAILSAFLSSSGDGIEMAFLDGPKTDPNRRGPMGLWTVSSCNNSQGLEDAVQYDVELKLTKLYGFISGNGYYGTPTSDADTKRGQIIGDVGVA